MKLAIAFDQLNKNDFWSALDRFEESSFVVKIGLRLLPHLNRSDFLKIKDKGCELFVDAKLHDIPSQVADTVKYWGDMGADYLTIHTQGGGEMIQKSVESSKAYPMRLLGVTLLTSIGEKELSSLGLAFGAREYVDHLVEHSWQHSLRSFVCSVQEAGLLKKRGAFVVCPGIHLEDSSGGGDQSRVGSLKMAMEQKVDVVVIGRSIWNAEDPVVKAMEVVQKIQ